MIGFIIWALAGAFLAGMGISAFFSKKPVSFWANVKPIKVDNVKEYNRATGLLFIIYGVVFILLGLPLIKDPNSPLILLSTVGVMFETIVMMAVYSVCIVKKYSSGL